MSRKPKAQTRARLPEKPERECLDLDPEKDSEACRYEIKAPTWQWLIDESERARRNLAAVENPDRQRIKKEIIEAVARFFRRCLENQPSIVCEGDAGAKEDVRERHLDRAHVLKREIQEHVADYWFWCAPYVTPFVDQNDSHVFDKKMRRIGESMQRVIIEVDKPFRPQTPEGSTEGIPVAVSQSGSVKRKRGPKTDYERAGLVARTVGDVAADGDWRPKLDEICKVLDEQHVRKPAKWSANDGRKYRTWQICCDREPSLAIKAIGYWLNVAKKGADLTLETTD